MIAGLLLGLLADLVFDAAAAGRRDYEAALERYFARRGFPSDRPGSTTHRAR
jgi:hypothetical protein